MGVRTRNPADPACAGTENRLDVRFIVRTGVDNDQLPGPNQVSIGSGAGHHAGVGRNDAGDLAIEALRDTGL
jgi:hypothetical protein